MSNSDEIIKEYGYSNFKFLEEDWSEYLIEGGTLLRIKTVPLKFLGEGKEYGMNATNMLVTFSPKELRGAISNKPITESDIQSSIEKPEMKIEPQKEPWNEYELDNGDESFSKNRCDFGFKHKII